MSDLAPSQQCNHAPAQKLEHKSGSVPGNSPEMEKVEGVRRIWGTVRSCTSRTILTTLQKFSTVAERVEVRRKFKKCRDIRVQWWFLIRGEEGVLEALQKEWESIQSQTSWKLECCHKPVQGSGEQSSGDVSSFLSIR